jgi:signal transduction histidine kinase
MPVLRPIADNTTMTALLDSMRFRTMQKEHPFIQTIHTFRAVRAKLLYIFRNLFHPPTIVFALKKSEEPNKGLVYQAANDNLHDNRDELELMLKELQQQLEEKVSVLNIVGHEIINPISCLKGTLQLTELCLQQNDSATALRLLHKAVQQTGKLAVLCDQLLQTTKQAAIPTRFQPVSILEILNDCIESFHFNYPTHTVNEEEIPNVLIAADRLKMERVFTNLLSNAGKYSPPHSAIEIRSIQHADSIEILIQDHGVGIPAENLPYIFEKYYRIPGAENKAPGRGIGLYLVCEIIKEHNGKIWVESDPETGSVFHVLLPITSVTNEKV